MAETFSSAMRRYIGAGYAAPDAMRATWHDVKIGRVERPRRKRGGPLKVVAKYGGSKLWRSPGGRYRWTQRGLSMTRKGTHDVVHAEDGERVRRAWERWSGRRAPRRRNPRDFAQLPARAAGRLVRDDPAVRGLPRRGYCVQLSDGRELCHDSLGYYLVGTKRNPLTRQETARVLRGARGAARLAATESPRTLARGFWQGKAEAGFQITDRYGASTRRPELRRWRAADPLRRTGAAGYVNPWVQGALLTARQRDDVRRAFVHRDLAIGPRRAYPTEDAWIRDHAFFFTKAGVLATRPRYADLAFMHNPMSRKDFIAIADQLHGLALKRGQEHALTAARALVPALKAGNARFDEQRFLDYVVSGGRRRRNPTIVPGKKQRTWGGWYKHDVVMEQGKEIGRIQTRVRPGSRGRRDYLTLEPGAQGGAVLGSDVGWLVRSARERGEINPSIRASEIRSGDVILPPARELSLWMRRHLKERGLPESALELTVESVRQGAPDKRGPWLIVTTRQSPAWLAGRTTSSPFTFKVRPTSPWPLLRRGAAGNPIPWDQLGPQDRAAVEQLLREDSALYAQIYGIRRGHFQPTHIGLGTWGRQLPLGERAATRVAELSKQRSRVRGRIRSIEQRARRGQSNPPARVTRFYDGITEVRGVKGRRFGFRSGTRFKHPFRSRPRAYGVDRGGSARLRRGDVVLRGRQPIYAQLG